jgi:hypothetical protein
MFDVAANRHSPGDHSHHQKAQKKSRIVGNSGVAAVVGREEDNRLVIIQEAE